MYIGWGRGLCKPLQARANPSQFVTLPTPILWGPSEPEGAFLEESSAQCNGCRGDVGAGTVPGELLASSVHI